MYFSPDSDESGLFTAGESETQMELEAACTWRGTDSALSDSDGDDDSYLSDWVRSQGQHERRKAAARLMPSQMVGPTLIAGKLMLPLLTRAVTV